MELAVAEAERVLAEHGREIAALIVEPLMQGAAGNVGAAARAICRRCAS